MCEKKLSKCYSMVCKIGNCVCSVCSVKLYNKLRHMKTKSLTLNKASVN